MEKKKHIAFWILFPIGFLILAAIAVFILDLTNGPLALFVIELIILAALAVTSILLINRRAILRAVPWAVAFMMTVVLCMVSKPIVRETNATLTDKFETTNALTLANGEVKGAYTADKEVEVYAGIPYAKAPVGELRWKEPQPAENWEGVRDCTKFHAKSMQPGSNPIMNSLVEIYAQKSWHPNFRTGTIEPRSEDSLYLNIWRPAKFTGELPILVYIHGGSLTSGSSAFSDYNGETFARNGVITITIAYRLGVFGYFAHPDLKAESPNGTTGNYGLLDQIQALKWVNENASYFGGDKNNITIAGESAGSSSVSAICASPLAKGLFRRAIGESSSVVAPHVPHTFRTLDKAYETADKILKEQNCSSVEELRKVPAEKLVGTAYSNDCMVVDGYALPKMPYEIYQDGNNNEEALLNGYNVKEADAFVVPKFLTSPTNKNNIRERLADYFDAEAADQFLERYRDRIESDAFGTFNDIISHYWFMQPHFEWSTIAHDKGVNVYRYQFTKENGYYGTYHSGEMIYCYGNVGRAHQFAYDDSDYALSKTMVGYWTNFAKTGNPNGDSLPIWSPWDPVSNKLQELGTNIGPIEERALPSYKILSDYVARKEASQK